MQLINGGKIMKIKNQLFLISFFSISFVALSCILGWSFCGQTGMQGQGQEMKHSCPMMMKDVSINTSDIDKGVRIEITSDNPDTIKMIQEHAAMHTKMKEKMQHHMKEEGKEGCCKHDCPCNVEGANISITNMEKGVAMEITSDNEESVKEIRSRAEKIKQMHKPEEK